MEYKEEFSMSPPNELLKDHPLYGLDWAIADYLAPVLEKKFEDLFLRYRRQEDAQTAAAVSATAQLGAGLVGQPLTLQEELLASPGSNSALSQAWNALLNGAAGEWRELCQLYSDIRTELRDLACMGAALEVALQSGDSAHAALVRDILSLDSALEPAWIA